MDDPSGRSVAGSVGQNSSLSCPPRRLRCAPGTRNSPPAPARSAWTIISRSVCRSDGPSAQSRIRIGRAQASRARAHPLGFSKGQILPDRRTMTLAARVVKAAGASSQSAMTVVTASGSKPPLTIKSTTAGRKAPLLIPLHRHPTMTAHGRPGRILGAWTFVHTFVPLTL